MGRGGRPVCDALRVLLRGRGLVSVGRSARRCRRESSGKKSVFPAAYEGGEDVRCAGIRSGDTVTLTVREPARMADVTVTLRREDGGYRAEISGPDFPASVPMDPAASRALCDVFVLLYGADARSLPSGDGAAEDILLPTVSRSGEETVFRYPAGTLVFDGAGMPVRVLCRDMAGGERTVLFGDYVMEGP